MRRVRRFRSHPPEIGGKWGSDSLRLTSRDGLGHRPQRPVAEPVGGLGVGVRSDVFLRRLLEIEAELPVERVAYLVRGSTKALMPNPQQESLC